MTWDALPTSVEVAGKEYAIRSDFRPVLDIMDALSDPDLSGEDRAEAVLTIFYPDVDEMPPEDYQEAISKFFWFMNGGEEPQKKNQPRLLDWEQDFPLIVGPVNRVLGKEVRDLKYLHWWTFQSAFMEIGDCTFAQVVNIRGKLARGKKMDKSDKEFYNRNRNLVDFKRKYSSTEKDLIASLT